jgi:hypothetical protein
MGWASGSYIMNDIIDGMKDQFPYMPSTREIVYRIVIPALENGDWDTQDESMGLDPSFDVVMKDLHPDWDWDGE